VSDGIANTEDGDSYANVEQRIFQSCPEPSSPSHPGRAARLGTPGLGYCPAIPIKPPAFEFFSLGGIAW
jgi:hypothetical protein